VRRRRRDPWIDSPLPVERPAEDLLRAGARVDVGGVERRDALVERRRDARARGVLLDL
jgi:hypothetical protein